MFYMKHNIYMLRPISRIDHSADWAPDLPTDRFFSIPLTGRVPFIGQCQSYDSGRTVGRLDGQSANCTASVETIQMNVFYLLTHTSGSQINIFLMDDGSRYVHVL
jgi:hypothetical protein